MLWRYISISVVTVLAITVIVLPVSYPGQVGWALVPMLSIALGHLYYRRQAKIEAEDIRRYGQPDPDHEGLGEFFVFLGISFVLGLAWGSFKSLGFWGCAGVGVGSAVVYCLGIGGSNAVDNEAKRQVDQQTAHLP